MLWSGKFFSKALFDITKTSQDVYELESIEANESFKAIVGIFINIILAPSVHFLFLYWDHGDFRTSVLGVLRYLLTDTFLCTLWQWGNWHTFGRFCNHSMISCFWSSILKLIHEHLSWKNHFTYFGRFKWSIFRIRVHSLNYSRDDITVENLKKYVFIDLYNIVDLMWNL